MDSKRFIVLKKVTIPAELDRAFDIEGIYFRVKESSGAFKLQTDQGEYFDMEVGLGFGDANHDPFKQLVFKNDSDTDIDVQFYVSNVPINDSRLNSLDAREVVVGTQNPSTSLVPLAGTLSPGSSVSFSGTLLGKKRKMIALFNLDDTEDLKISNSTGLINGGTIKANAIPIALETDATVKLLNPITNANTITYEVTQLFYA